MSEPIPTRPLGRTGVQVSIFGLGGEGVLRTYNREDEAEAVIRAAHDQGVTYYDCARAYAGSEMYHGRVYKTMDPALRKRLFQASKSAQRGRKAALFDLDTTLRTMRLDYLDLWQIHDVRAHQELDELQAPGGALEAADEARKAGKIRFVGVTGHYDPEVLSAALDIYPFDTVLMPVNALEPHFMSFVSDTLPRAVAKGMGIIGMKVPCRGYLLSMGGLTMEESMGYALSQPVSTVIIGCDTPAHVEENAAIARRFTPMSETGQEALLRRTRSQAGELLFYKKGIALT